MKWWRYRGLRRPPLRKVSKTNVSMMLNSLLETTRKLAAMRVLDKFAVLVAVGEFQEGEVVLP